MTQWAHQLSASGESHNPNPVAGCRCKRSAVHPVHHVLHHSLPILDPNGAGSINHKDNILHTNFTATSATSLSGIDACNCTICKGPPIRIPTNAIFSCGLAPVGGDIVVAILAQLVHPSREINAGACILVAHGCLRQRRTSHATLGD